MVVELRVGVEVVEVVEDVEKVVVELWKTVEVVSLGVEVGAIGAVMLGETEVKEEVVVEA